MELDNFLKLHSKVAVAFSGGVDSSYLLYAAKSAGCDVHAYFIKSQFQPQFELDDARRLSDFLEVPLTVGTVDSLADKNISNNPADRCYHCKNTIFSMIRELAKADGYSVIFDGTNADDDESDRAGMRALREMKVLSPLQECGLTKSKIRQLSLEAGLFTHDKPSYACLATRIPTGTIITNELLAQIENSEDILFKMGFTDFRIRVIPPDNAKLQVPESQWLEVAERRKDILLALKGYFTNVMLDLSTR